MSGLLCGKVAGDGDVECVYSEDILFSKEYVLRGEFVSITVFALVDIITVWGLKMGSRKWEVALGNR